jgi:S-adenosylmethionine-dependent carboxyl methyltransferase
LLQQAKAFGVVTSGFLDKKTREVLVGRDQAVAEILDNTPRSVSMFLAPTGELIGEVLQDNEGILYADFFIPCSTGAVRAEFERQAALDWEAFLTLRATELRPGGRLVVALPSLADDGSTAFAAIMDHANAVLSELVTAGLITAEERRRMTLASCPRRQRDLLAPFAKHKQFRRLLVEHCTTSVVADKAWDEYQLDKDAEALARKRAQFFRAIFVPSLAQALAPSRGPEERQAFGAALEAGLRRRLVDYPTRVDHLVGMIVLAMQGAE